MLNPLVSISCITYNHEQYIRQCIEGFLIQKTNFNFEILIHDDASTDKTAEIIREYEAKFPEIIIPIYQTENQYSKGIKVAYHFNLSRAKGKYIALCEGDDYWTDPYKLQNQINFLENNQDYIMVYTNFITVNKDSKIRKRELRRLPMTPSGDVLKYLFKRNFIMTLTTVFRAETYFEAHSFLEKTEIFDPIDYALFFELARRGKIKYQPKATSAYRVLNESASHSKDYNNRIKFINNITKIIEYYAEKYNYKISQKKLKRKQTSGILSIYSKNNEIKLFFKTFFNSIKDDILNISIIKNYVYILLMFIQKK